MVNPSDRLSIFYSDDSVFTDYSNEACDFGRDTFDVTLISAEDYLLIGYSKPINAIYFDIPTPNTNSGTITCEYYNGSEWIEMDIYDDTKGFTRNGFIQWEKDSNDDKYQNLLKEAEINSKDLYFIRFSISSDTTAITFNGINVIFSDDSSLQSEFPSILDSSFFTNSETNHILSHVASRNEIIQKFRKQDKDLSPWDILDIDEVKTAATYLCLSKIFLNVSDNKEDVWLEKYKFYKEEAYSILNSVQLTVNKADIGISEGSVTRQVFFSR